jgi:hypothetical protein
MSHCFRSRIKSSKTGSLKAKNCRRPVMRLRIGEDASDNRLEQQRLEEQRLEQQWQKIRGHATIVRDPEKLLLLTAELERRERLAKFAIPRHVK